MSMHHLHPWYPQRSEESIGIPGTGVMVVVSRDVSAGNQTLALWPSGPFTFLPVSISPTIPLLILDNRSLGYFLAVSFNSAFFGSVLALATFGSFFMASIRCGRAHPSILQIVWLENKAKG